VGWDSSIGIDTRYRLNGPGIESGAGEMGWNNSVGIATRYRLNGSGIESRS
jgi:hypothetical protein